MRAARVRPARARVLRLAGVREDEEMSWKKYALAVLLFNLLGASWSTRCSAYKGRCRSIPRDSLPSLPSSSFNTAVSFATNTNWQAYGGETTMSYLTQMLGAHGAEFRLGGRRHGGAGRLDPGLHAANDATGSATSGSISSAHALHPAAAVARARARAGVAGRRADIRRLRDGNLLQATTDADGKR